MDRLKKNRSAVRGATTRRLTSAAELLQQDSPSLEELQVALDDLLDKAAALKSLDEMIAELVDDEGCEEEAHGALEYHERIVNCISRIRFRTRSRSEADSTPAPGANVSTPRVEGDHTGDHLNGEALPVPGNSTSGGSRISTQRVALPKLQVPVFSGELREWQGFWEHFEATIHLRPDLPGIEKFKYLRSYLTGAAKRAVEWIRLTEENYATAVSVLTQRFGRTDALVDEHIDGLLAIAPIQSSSHLCRLRELYEQVLFRTSCLEGLGVPSAEYAVVLHRVLMRSLPEDLAVLYRQRMKEGITAAEPAASRAEQVKTITSFLQVQVESREEAQAARARHATKVVPPTTDRPQALSASPIVPSALALAASSTPQELVPCSPAASSVPVAPQRMQCPLCDSASHTIQDCHAAVSTEDKRRRLVAQRCCFRCGKPGHVLRRCRRASWLKCRHCSRRHLTTLCDMWRRNDTPANPSPTNGDGPSPPTDNRQPVQPVTTVPASVTSSSATLLQTATVWAAGRDQCLTLRVLFDTGSQRTFIRRDVSLKLNLPCVDEEDLTVFTFGSSARPRRYHCRKVRVELRSLRGGKSVTLDALEVPEVCTVKTAEISPDLMSHLQNKGLHLADQPTPGGCLDSVVSVLIGSDLYWTVVSGCVDRLNEHMCAVETAFGWTVQGAYAEAVHPLSTNNHSATLFLACSDGWCPAPPAGDPSEMWRLDAIGISERTDEPIGEPAAVLQFREGVYKENGRYVVPIMLKSHGLLTRTNRTVAETRLKRQLQRFQAQPDVLREYDSVIREYPKEGHAEQVPPNDDPELVYYLPHHAVVRREAVTTKVRVVFDASSHEVGSPSLNDVLDKGVKLGAELLQLLLQFRCSPIILTADIRKAFLQICIRPEERDLLRFLWFDKVPGVGQATPEICEWRMTRVPFGASSSPFLLAATVQHHLETWKGAHPDIATRLQKSFYVDDLVIGAQSEAEAMYIYRTANAILADAGMELRKWCSSSTILNEQFYADGISIDNVAEPTTSCKVLGLGWDRKADDVVMSTQNVSSYVATQPATKRTVLQAFARVYDPLGLIAPFVLRAKLLFQELWRRQKDWDEPLESDSEEQWAAWTSELGVLSSVRVPRCVVPAQGVEGPGVEFHIFCDAGPQAYGVVVYVRQNLSEDQYAVRLLMSKCRVAPIKPVSLPRLELLACLLAARLWNYVTQVPELSGYKAWFWTDSAIALHWIVGDVDRRDTFVRNRVSEIRRLTEAFTWQHCRSEDNPADLITRGAPASFATQKLIWWSGPSWLSLPELVWPPRAVIPTAREDDSGQVAVCTAVAAPSSSTEPLLDVRRYGHLHKLLRVTAWMKRFLQNAGGRQSLLRGPLSTAELQDAELYWLKHVQESAFPREITALRSGQPLPSDSPVLTLRPFLDSEGLLRVGGRLQMLLDPEDVKHPVLLPNGHRFTEMLIEATHVRLLHGGVQLTLVDLRSRFWIPSGRRTVKRVLNSCLPCRRRRICRETAPVAPLPRDRITETTPFGVVGVDFCGPLYCKTPERTQSKVYILVFSCAVTRAVHLELTMDMTAQTFLLAFRRFVARRGMPSTVYSDNARTFRCCSRVLGTAANEAVLDYASTHRIHWKFIAERAPWWGGFWERVIRTIKDALRRSLGRSSLRYEELLTVLLQVEAAVNSRPLTRLTDDIEDKEVLTPSHFLLGRCVVSLPPPVDAPASSSSPASLRRRCRLRESLVKRLWVRWKRDYLLLLRSGHHASPAPRSTLQVGDVVIVEDDSVPALEWKMGRVVDALPGRDGVERYFTVVLPSGQRIRRPVQRLYLLEADITNAAGEDVGD